MSKLEHQDEFGAWIELPPGTEFVKIEEIPELIANALWPNIEPMIGGVYDEEADMDATFSRLSAKELVKQELRADASNPSFEVLDPITRGPFRFRVGRAFEGGLVTVATLTEYVRPRRIGVRLIPTFVTEAWPKSVPPNLAELPDDAKVHYVCRVGTQCGSGTCTAGEYRKQVEATIARQGEGHFTLDEAAQVLADSRAGLDPKEAVKRFRLAHSKGELRIHQGESRFPLEVGETVRDFWDTVEVSELDAWLRDTAGYGFPQAGGAYLPTPVATSATGRPQRKTWRDVAWDYVVGRLRAGKFSSAVELNHTLHAEAERDDSPFDKGEGHHRGSLWVREIAQPLKLKTIQNAWQELRTDAGLK